MKAHKEVIKMIESSSSIIEASVKLGYKHRNGLDDWLKRRGLKVEKKTKLKVKKI